VTNELLAVVQADHYVFSTNNAIFNHPNDESVSRVLVHGGKQPTLWFNYATQRNRRWADTALRTKYGYEAKYPAGDNAGVTLALPARSARSGRH
jgi:hypothetical protein